MSLGGNAEGNTGNAAETRTSSTTKSASENLFRGSDVAGTGSQTVSVEMQTDNGTNLLTVPTLQTLLLLLGAGCLCL